MRELVLHVNLGVAVIAALGAALMVATFDWRWRCRHRKHAGRVGDGLVNEAEQHRSEAFEALKPNSAALAMKRELAVLADGQRQNRLAEGRRDH